MIRWIRWAIVCAVFVSLSCSESLDPKAKTEAMFDAANRHDVTAALAFYAEDVTYLMPGETPIHGREALRKYFEWDSTLNMTLEVGELTAFGDTVVVGSFVEGNQFMTLLGVKGLHSLPGSRYIFENGLIKKVEFSGETQEDAGLLRTRFGAFMNWFVHSYPGRVKEVRDRSFFQSNRERASDWLQLATEYKEWRSSRGMLN